eukprot:211304-Amphidinium_carterae.1
MDKFIDDDQLSFRESVFQVKKYRELQAHWQCYDAYARVSMTLGTQQLRLDYLRPPAARDVHHGDNPLSLLFLVESNCQQRLVNTSECTEWIASSNLIHLSFGFLCVGSRCSQAQVKGIWLCSEGQQETASAKSNISGYFIAQQTQSLLVSLGGDELSVCCFIAWGDFLVKLRG